MANAPNLPRTFVSVAQPAASAQRRAMTHSLTMLAGFAPALRSRWCVWLAMNALCTTPFVRMIVVGDMRL